MWNWSTRSFPAFGLTVPHYGLCYWAYIRLLLNPAVTIGLWSGGRFDGKDVAPYIIAQVIGGIIAGWRAICYSFSCCRF